MTKKSVKREALRACNIVVSENINLLTEKAVLIKKKCQWQQLAKGAVCDI